MVNRHTALKIRKTHRYLGLFLGIQFLFWTISGLYFSWTNIDEIHGDHFKNMEYQPKAFNNLISPSQLNGSQGINTIELRDINNSPYYWVNNNQLYNAIDGSLKSNITKEEALYIAQLNMKDGLKVVSIEQIGETGKQHEYREKLLPAYVISYESDEALKSYVSITDGKFQTVRHRSWRWFDFLWMTHTMDYEGRDNFNTIVLRVFSLLGLITVLSGFLLWFTSSPTIRKLKKKILTQKPKIMNTQEHKNGMSNYTKFFLMLGASFVAMYITMYLNTYEFDHVWISLTRFYMVCLGISTMALIMFFFMKNMYSSKKKNLGIVIGSIVLFLGALGLVRDQESTVGDVLWMKGMIPHHSIAILTSERADIKDPEVKQLAEDIIKAQKKEIEEMKAMIKRLENEK